MSENTLTLSSFFSKASAEEGKKLFLKLPNQTVTDHWLLVVGKDSDTFADSAKKYRLATVDAKDDESKQKEATFRHLARMVKGWSFAEPFSEDAVYDLLIQAPHIVEDLEETAYNRKVFFSEAAK